MAGAIAVLYETPTEYARYTVADGTAIPKGTILQLTDPNTASASSAEDEICAGIAMYEKVASDGTTEITAALNGVWGLKSSAAIDVGADVGINGLNEIKTATTLDREKGWTMGTALETSAGAVVMKIRVRV